MATKAVKPSAETTLHTLHGNGPSDSRFDRRLSEILKTAAEVFYEKGYEGASMRDLSRRTGMSLAGLYYYFESKDKLLYLIQRHTFSMVLQRLEDRLGSASDAEDAVRIMIRNHIEYFVANMTAMKVLAHEADTLKNGYGQQIQAIKREYYRVCTGLLEDLRKSKLGRNAPPPRKNEHRVAVMSLFGMINWIYTWYNPQIDPDSSRLADRIADMFLCGVLSERQTAKAIPSRFASRPGHKKDPSVTRS
jgi:AcrR family transcriptional regulator